MNNIFLDIQLFDIMGRIISCMVTTYIVFKFVDAKYIRIYDKKFIYIFIKVGCCLANLAVYCLNSPVANISFWIIVISLVSRFLYFEEKISKFKYYFVNISFIFAYSICEGIGGILLGTCVEIMDITQKDSIISFVYTIGGSAIAILLYYLVLQRLFIGEKTKRIAVTQYWIYALISIYVLLNVGEILFLMKYELSGKDYLFLLLVAIFIIIINLYLFHLLDMFSENRDLKYKLALYERQAKSNYEYYAKQIESNKTALSVIHDIRKHIRILEDLKQTSISSEIQKYTDAFENMIEPLLVKQYCGNIILNIIINDKVDYCQKHFIKFCVDVQNICFDYMKPIDITTVFGNILDNAIEACEKTNDKELSLKIYPFNDFVYVEVINSFCGDIKWDKKGHPMSLKGEGHGIGLENVEKVLQDYNGNIQYSLMKEKFVVEIMFSRP